MDTDEQPELKILPEVKSFFEQLLEGDTVASPEIGVIQAAVQTQLKELPEPVRATRRAGGAEAFAQRALPFAHADSRTVVAAARPLRRHHRFFLWFLPQGNAVKHFRTWPMTCLTGDSRATCG